MTQNVLAFLLFFGFQTHFLHFTCSIKAPLASLTACITSGSSEGWRALISKARPSCVSELPCQVIFCLVIKSTNPVKLFPEPMGICKYHQISRQNLFCNCRWLPCIKKKVTWRRTGLAFSLVFMLSIEYLRLGEMRMRLNLQSFRSITHATF